MRPSRRLTAAGIAAASTLLEKFSISAFLPALPILTQAYGSSVHLSQQSVAVYTIGVALSQLVWGYLSDIWGRRPVLLVLTPIYVAGCLTTALSTGLPSALVGFFLQGFGVGAMFSVTQALVGDSFGKAGSTKALAYIALVISWGAAVGVLIGGWLVHHFPWQTVFVFLAGFALLVAPLYCLVSDLPGARSHRLSLRAVGREYLSLIRHQDYLRHVLVVMLHNAVLFAFYTVSPFLLIDDLALGPGHYSTLMLIPLSGFMLGRFICGRLTDHMESNAIINLGNVTALLGAAAMVGAVVLLDLGAMTIMVPMALYLIGMGIAAPAARANAMHVNALLIGTAASLLSVIVNAFAAASSFVAAHLVDTAMPGYILVVSISNLVLFAVLARRRQGRRSLSLD
ncbi:MAG: multidrug effflux MFS transporter [Hyphomicrobiales bacterium]|nr:multidrug effflux MFS transporter [Hyphomicrobiales bacterium]